MAEAKIAAKQPAVLDLEAGSYHYCTCGESQNQPYCDGSHKETGFTPLEFFIDEPKKVALCQCKRTAKAPYCDGAHKTL